MTEMNEDVGFLVLPYVGILPSFGGFDIVSPLFPSHLCIRLVNNIFSNHSKYLIFVKMNLQNHFSAFIENSCNHRISRLPHLIQQ